MWSDRPRLRRPANGGDEHGFAMIVCLMVITIVLVMTLGMLATGIHLQTATSRDRRWNTALQVAEAGVDRTVYEYNKSSSYTGSGLTTMLGGQYETTVTSPKTGYLRILSTGYVPSKTALSPVKRKIQVDYGPYRSFSFAMFSDAGIDVKNNLNVTGDLFGNGSIVIEKNAEVNGSVISATGTVDIENNSSIKQANGSGGSVTSGGYDLSGNWGIRLGNNAVIEGSVYAKALSCPGTALDDSRYNVSNGGTIEGDALARGNINGSVLGTSTPFNCQPREASRTLPEFHFDASLYPSVTQFTSAAAFQAYVDANSSSLTGTFRVNDSTTSNVIDLGGVTITGDFTLITNTLIDFANNASITAPQTATIDIISLNSSSSPPAINVKNNLSLPNTNAPAVLMYSPGLISLKNNDDTNGALYGGALQLKNGGEITYDPRVERTVGFGPVRYDRVSWQELPA